MGRGPGVERGAVRAACPSGEVRYRARFFGPFEVFRDDEPFARHALSRASSRTLLKWFLMHPGVAIPAPDVVGLLWPHGDPTTGATRLYGTLHHLRRALEPDLPPRANSAFIKCHKGSYRFELGGQWETDMLRSSELIGAARAQIDSGASVDAIASLERYIQICSNTFLPEDLYEDPFQDIRANHELQLHRAQAKLLQLYLSDDMCHRALSFALSIQSQDPCNEPATLAIAQVHLRNGNPAAAARQLAAHITTLQRELGLEPDPKIPALLQRIRTRLAAMADSPGGKGLPHA